MHKPVVGSWALRRMMPSLNQKNFGLKARRRSRSRSGPAGMYSGYGSDNGPTGSGGESLSQLRWLRAGDFTGAGSKRTLGTLRLA